MGTPTESFHEWVQDQAKRAHDKTDSWGMRLASWLVVGNAAALGLTLKALTETSPVSTQTLVLVAWSFVCGLAAAFAGGAISWIGLLFSLHMLSQMGLVFRKVVRKEFAQRTPEMDAEDRADALSLNEDEVKVRIAELGKFNHWVVAMSGIAGALFIASAGAFLFGLITPLRSLSDPAIREKISASQPINSTSLEQLTPSSRNMSPNQERSRRH